jgi:peptidyl-prolyl cis-trans isomerase A (cyclophilin A)
MNAPSLLKRRLHRTLWVLAFGVLGLSVSGYALAQSKPRVKFVTNVGEFVVELQSDIAPATATHFLNNVNGRVYDNTIFHRLVGDFVLQGGGFDPAFVEKPIRNRLVHEGQDLVARSNFRNTAGTLAMARGTGRDSAGNEFFINLADNTDLDPVAIPPGDPVARFELGGKVFNNVPRERLLTATELWGYTPFARIVSGAETVDRIKKMSTGKIGPFAGEVPLPVVVINRAEVMAGTGTGTATTASVAPAKPVAPAAVPAPAPVNQVAAAPALAPATAAPANANTEVSNALNRWASAWSAKNVPEYIASYAPDYKAAGNKSRKEWEEQRNARIVEKSKISLKLERVEIQVNGDTAVARFNQSYQADAVVSNSPKVITFTKIGGRWLITKEESR